MALADPITVFRLMLLTKADLVALVGLRVYGSPTELRVPAGYRPDLQGPCIAFTLGPASQDYSSAVHSHSVDLRGYAATEAAAQQLIETVYEQVNDRRYPPILIARQTQGLQVMQEPDTGWFAGLATYEIQLTQPAHDLIAR